MMTSRRMLLASVALGAVFAAGPLTAAELRMTVWTGNEAHLEMLNGIAESFRQIHPDVTVKFETIPFADYVQKLTFQLAGGNPPDLGWLMENAATTFAQAGVLEDVGPALRGNAEYDFADLSEPAMSLWVDGESVYGVPFSTSPFIIFFNKTMFDKAGIEDPYTLASKGEWNMETFQAAAKAVAEANDTWGYEFKDGEGYTARVLHALVPNIMAYGGTAWEDKECGFASPESIAAVQQLHDMVFDDGSIVPPGEKGDFFAGDAAMTQGQIGAFTKLADADFEWGVAPLPTGPAGYVPVTGQAAIVVFAQGEQKDLATEFLAHMTNQENVGAMSAFFPPARQSVLDSGVMAENIPAVSADQLKIITDAIALGTVLPAHENMPQIQAAMAAPVDALWRADADVPQALEEVCTAIAPLL